MKAVYDHRGVDLISRALPFGRLCYGEPNAIDYAKFRGAQSIFWSGADRQ